MGLFGKLFSKEACIVCGNEVGSLKRKRLADGIICKDCARKLSPWFDAYKQSSAEQIKGQLAARAQDHQRLRAGFTITGSYGEQDAIVVDASRRLFCVLADAGRRGFGSVDDVLAHNPDVFTFDQLEGIDIDTAGISHREVKHSVDGEQVSYSPRRYEYPCNVTVNLRVDSPYVHSMAVRLNPSTINIQTEGERIRTGDLRSAGQMTADWLLGRGGDVRQQAEAWADNSLEARLTRPFEQALRNPQDNYPDYAFGFKCSRENWPRIQEYGRFVQMAAQARAALLGA